MFLFLLVSYMAVGNLVEGHFQIGEGHIVSRDAIAKGVKAFITVLGKPTGDEHIAGGNEGGFGHGKPPVCRYVALQLDIFA